MRWLPRNIPEVLQAVWEHLVLSVASVAVALAISLALGIWCARLPRVQAAVLGFVGSPWTLATYIIEGKSSALYKTIKTMLYKAPGVLEALLSLLPERGIGRVLDIGTGTGRLLELLAPRVSAGLGVDASRAMLALARARLAQADLAHLAVRQADMYRLSLPDRAYDLVVLQMVLHYADDPAAVLAEAARVLAPGGRLVVVDLAAHGRDDLAAKLAHRWPGFTDDAVRARLRDAGLRPSHPISVPGALEVRLWPALLPLPAPSPPAHAPHLATEDA